MSRYIGDVSAYALAVSQGYTGTEEEYAELMASYATVAQTAVNAKDAAVAANTAAQSAKTAAAGSASTAQTAATTATSKANEATTAAGTATTKAAEASQSASTASTAASTASTKASEATTAAGTATTAKNDAVAAKTAAQTAQTGAETAAASVQSSAAQIQTNADDISELKEDLNDISSLMPTNGNRQLFNKLDDVTVINARLSSAHQLITDNNYRAVIIPQTITSGERYWAKIFNNNVTVAEIYVYTLNSYTIGSNAVDYTNSTTPANKVTYINTSANADYLCVVMRLSTGTIDDVIDGLVVAKGSTEPSAYTNYYANVDTVVWLVDNKVNNVEIEIDNIKSLLATNGENNQFFSIEKDANVINARVSSGHKLITDNNYRAIIFPHEVKSSKKYWARIFSSDVTVSEIYLYTFNSSALNSAAVDYINATYTANKSSAITTTATASYICLVVKLSTGTVADVLSSVVFAQSNDEPSQYEPYYISVDEAVSRVISPDCVEVGKTAENYPYTDIGKAISENPSAIIKVNYGTYETEVSNLTTNKTIIGEDIDLCVLTGTNKDYDTPPIEIAGGIVKNVTVNMVNADDAEHKGYCIHSDNSACVNNELIIENCKFTCVGTHAIGMGAYNGETIFFKNCEFVFNDEEDTPTNASLFIHDSGNTTNVATIKFHDCIFRSAYSYAMKLQEWAGCCVMEFEFINCTCISGELGTGNDCIWTDYNTGTSHDPSKLHTFDGVRMKLLPSSHGNNVPMLNYVQ